MIPPTDEESMKSSDKLLEEDGQSSMGIHFKDFTEQHLAHPKRWSDCLRNHSSLFTHLAIIIVYTTAFIFILGHVVRQWEHGPDYTYSPVHEVMKWERKFIDFEVNSTNPYKGQPSPELDTAWEALFTYNNIRVTQAELVRMNRTSVQLSDGSGDYLAAIDVFHHLHCLKMVRHYIHPEYYKMPDSQKVTIHGHIDHCLDAIRQELMCRAETTFTTYSWLPDLSIPWATLSYDHTCVNFEAINEWARSRSVDIFAPGMVIHPVTGPSFPHGDTSPSNVIA